MIATSSAPGGVSALGEQPAAQRRTPSTGSSSAVTSAEFTRRGRSGVPRLTEPSRYAPTPWNDRLRSLNSAHSGSRDPEVVEAERRERAGDEDQPLGLGIRQRLEQHAVDDAEDGGVGADAERERQDRDRGVAGLFARVRRAWARSWCRVSIEMQLQTGGGWQGCVRPEPASRCGCESWCFAFRRKAAAGAELPPEGGSRRAGDATSGHGWVIAAVSRKGQRPHRAAAAAQHVVPDRWRTVRNSCDSSALAETAADASGSQRQRPGRSANE